MKQNCWEFKKCGRHPGGEKVEELGVCPASVHEELDGSNDGKNGGRICWLLKATFCGAQVQGDFFAKLGNCLKCPFLKSVFKEQSGRFSYGMEHLARVSRDED